MLTSHVRRETALATAHKFHQQYNRSTPFHHCPTILVSFAWSFQQRSLKIYKKIESNSLGMSIFTIFKCNFFLFQLVSGSTSPTTRRLEYPYSYDSASKWNLWHFFSFRMKSETNSIKSFWFLCCFSKNPFLIVQKSNKKHFYFSPFLIKVGLPMVKEEHGQLNVSSTQSSVPSPYSIQQRYMSPVPHSSQP